MARATENLAVRGAHSAANIEHRFNLQIRARQGLALFLTLVPMQRSPKKSQELCQRICQVETIVLFPDFSSLFLLFYLHIL